MVSAGRVLVIEDDAGIARLLRRSLGFKGIETTVAEDGFAARRAWKSGGFDLVLLDVTLPELDGIDLCAERRAAGDETPVILLTARDEGEIRERAAAASVTDYIGKPFSYEDLISRVERYLPGAGDV